MTEELPKEIGCVEVRLDPKPVLKDSEIKSETLQLRFQEIRTRSQEKRGRIFVLINEVMSSKREEVLGKEMTLEEIQKSVKELETEELLPDNYLVRSGFVINAIAQRKSKISEEERQLVGDVYSFSFTEKTKIQREIDQLNKIKGIRRLFIPSKRKRLIKEADKLEQKTSELNKRRDEKKVELKILQELETPVDKKRDDVFCAEICKAVEEITNDYEGFLGELLDDRQIVDEITESYIDKVIVPFVEKSEVAKKLLPEQKDEFYTVLRDFLAHRDLPDEKKMPYRQALDRCLTAESGLSYLDSVCAQLSFFPERSEVRNLITILTARELEPILEEIKNNSSRHWELREKVLKGINNAVFPDSDRIFFSQFSFGKSVLEQLDEDKYRILPPNMQFWVHLLSSKTAKKIFKDNLTEIDDSNYNFFLRKSLTDSHGTYIDSLYYFPRPDSVRNLLLLAAADYRQYRTVHANGTLARLAQRPDWASTLDEAEKKYPEIKSLRTLLENWNFTGYQSNTELQQGIGEFALSLYKTTSDDKELSQIVTEALPNSSIIKILKEKGVISSSDAENFTKAESLLSEISKESWKLYRQDNTTPHVESYYFVNALRESLFPLLLGVGSREQQLFVLNKFKLLSELILEYKTDFKVLDVLVSDIFIKTVRDNNKKIEGVVNFLHEFHEADEMLSSGKSIELTSKNWQIYLMMFIRLHNEVYGLPELSQKASERIKLLFEDPKNKNFCLNELSNLWKMYLRSGDIKEVPMLLSVVPGFIEYCGGAGPLSQLESLGSLILSIDRAFIKLSGNDNIKTDILDGLNTVEDRFTLDKWSNEDKTEFYTISRDMLEASPEMYLEFLSLFGEMSSFQFKKFVRELFPLYRTKLILFERRDQYGKKEYDAEKLFELKSDIVNFRVNLGKEDIFEEYRKKLHLEIQDFFKEKFGIILIPEKFTSETVLSIMNISVYLANLPQDKRTFEKETILGFYLSLMINNQWDKYRAGHNIKPEDLLIPSKAELINRLLMEQKDLNSLTAENLGISIDQMQEFYDLLQQETESIIVGSIETIDTKLTIIIINLQSYEDLDMYPDRLDKRRMKLLVDYGDKRVNSVVARMYQKLTNPGREIYFNAEEQNIEYEIKRIMKENELELSPQILKEYFQDGLRPLSIITNLLGFIKDNDVKSEIGKLRKLLEPSPEIIKAFKKLGEGFTSLSGAIPISQDLTYLDNLISRGEKDLNPEELKLLKGYVGDIKRKMFDLEKIYSQLKNKFSGLRQGVRTENPIFIKMIDEVDRIIHTSNDQQAVSSTFTNNLNSVIENIRACLSCTSSQGSNNDTNLTFGDMNKFLIFSRSESQKAGSVSDQLVFLEPYLVDDKVVGMVFVLDNIYGLNTPKILESHVDVLLKKYRLIKQRFPNIKLSVFITQAAVSTGGSSLIEFSERIKLQEIVGEIRNLEIDVIKSAMGDHYMEFSGMGRGSGKRIADGILISSN